MEPKHPNGTRRSRASVSWVILSVFASQLLHSVSSIEPFRAVDVLRTERTRSDTPVKSPPLQQPLGVQELWLEQRLDHFRSDARTFSQRYFYSNQYVQSNATDTYALLCCGGEGPDLDASVLVDSVHCSGDMLELAHILFHRNASVHLYALEHRYYGQSYPNFENEQSAVTNENLVYLSSRQAVADIAHFISHQNKQASTAAIHKKQQHQQWVTFGGSYPGMVAAWARLKYPHAVTAAVSNSAPIQAQLDFEAYNAHVASDLMSSDNGGSDACLQVFVQGHAALAGMLQDEAEHAQIAANFGLCNAAQLQDPASVQLFIGDGVYTQDIQGNDPSCDTALCNIEKVCSALLEQRSQGADAVDALAYIVREQQKDDECTNLDWPGTLAYLADPVRGQTGGLRSWLWQTCTEFGFYQTCEFNSTCPFGQGYHPVEQDLEMCAYVFGIDAAQVKDNIQETLDYYGGLELAGSQILSVTGDVDPWSELAKRTTNDPDLPVLTVVGASHHFWTHATKPTDAPAVGFAREIIHEQVLDWLEETGPDDDDSVPPTSTV